MHLSHVTLYFHWGTSYNEKICKIGALLTCNIGYYSAVYSYWQEEWTHTQSNSL